MTYIEHTHCFKHPSLYNEAYFAPLNIYNVKNQRLLSALCHSSKQHFCLSISATFWKDWTILWRTNQCNLLVWFLDSLFATPGCFSLTYIRPLINPPALTNVAVYRFHVHPGRSQPTRMQISKWRHLALATGGLPDPILKAGKGQTAQSPEDWATLSR